jgi:serine/threonine-protein kinase
MIGKKLGPYEITGKLGEGGMGEVYRATDTKLDRQVAIKVLPAAFTQDENRLDRFAREAKLLAQLHHPHIASIFGLEDAGGVRALVMELVEGPTLAERLQSGPLPVEDALAIARRIAEALEEAHEKGIIHRDLKPQNIKASLDGKVKVLDFGLAKAMDPAASDSSANPMASPTMMNSPTLTAAMGTQLGVILGTAAYMAPEQARGQAVDKRADIWAFGVVLYEMLAGSRLFASETVSDTLAAVIRKEVDLDLLREDTPPAIRRLLRRCLERNPKNRLHDIADARIVIAEVLQGDGGDPSELAPAPAPRLRGWPLWLAFAAAAALALAAGWLLRGQPASVQPDLRLSLSIPPGYTFPADAQPGLTLSADGRRQVVALEDDNGETHLLLRDLDQLESRFLEGTDGALSPILSPDGEWLAFVLEGELRKMSLAGGPSVRLGDADVGGDFRGGTWGTDGYLYVSPGTNNPIVRVSASGGPATPVTELDVSRFERTHRWPEVLPDASAVLFTCDTSESTEYYDDARIEAVDLATGKRKVVLEQSSQARFLAPDRLLFARGGTVFAVRFDAERLETMGSPVPILQGVATHTDSGAVRFATAASGTAIWISGDAETADGQLAWLDPDGKETALDLPPDSYSQLALSPDGRRLAATLTGTVGMDLWILDLDRGTKSRLTFSGPPSDPLWSPDGRRVFYGASSAESGLDIYSKAADGSGEPERVVQLDGDEYPASLTPDGGTLVLESHAAGRVDSDLLALDLTSGEIRPLVNEPYNEILAAISPDGRWMAYASLESSSRSQIVVRRYPELTGKWQISLEGGSEPHWSPEGDAIYFRGGGSLFRVPVDTTEGFHAGTPQKIADSMQRGSIATSFAVARGGRVLVKRNARQTQPYNRVAFDFDLAARARRLTEPKR